MRDFCMLSFKEQKKMGREKFHAPQQKLSFNTEAISLTLEPGEIREGTFMIEGPQNENVNGFVSSSLSSMSCLTPAFSGPREIIGYRFSAKPFSAGDSVEGYFRIISSHGEYRLPFHVKIMDSPVQTSLGAIHNLVHFTNLARTDWREAENVFYSTGFRTLIGSHEDKERRLYRGLSVEKGSGQNVEEFLCASGRKEPPAYEVTPQKLTVEIPGTAEKRIVQKLEIRRSGWGYTALEISVTGGFLQADRRSLREADFHAGVCTMAVAVNPGELHQGLNLAEIRLRSPYAETVVPVEVLYCVDTALRALHRKEVHEHTVRMMQIFLKMRMGQLRGEAFLTAMGAEITKLSELGRGDPLTALYRIHFLLTQNKPKEALWDLQLLNRRLSGLSEEEKLPSFPTAQFDLEDDVVYAYRMYLTLLCVGAADVTAQETEQVTEDALRALEDMHHGNPDSFWITWLYLFSTDLASHRTSEYWAVLTDQFRRGCRSPLLYIEAYRVIRLAPSIMTGLDDFILQTLAFAARNHLLTDAVVSQLTYMAGHAKNFHPTLLRVLSAAFRESDLAERKPEILESICSILIRGNMTDRKYFVWYQRGVNAQLMITRLFEYYMMAMPEDYDGEIPKIVVMYFAYQTALPYRSSAVLYRYVLEHRGEFETQLQQYQEQIRTYTQEHLLAHEMSRDLAYLYNWFFKSSTAMTPETAAAAVQAVFTCMVRSDRQDIQRAVLISGALVNEQYYPFRNGSAYIPVYGDDCQLFLENSAGERFAAPRDSLVRMMDYRNFAKTLALYNIDNIGFNLYLAENSDEGSVITKENCESFRNLAESEAVTPGCRGRIRDLLLRYYSAADDIRSMDNFLKAMNPSGMNSEERASMIRCMAIRGLNETALSWIREYGTFHVDGSTLVRVCSGLLDTGELSDDAVFAETVYETFRKGKYNEKLLLYMENCFDGLTTELEEIRKAALGFGAPDYPVCRRMLIQMLYTGELIPERETVIEDYCKGGADPSLMADVLAQSAHHYFINGLPMKRSSFDLIMQYGRGGVPLVDICRIAWLKDMAGRSGRISAPEREVTSLFLGDLVSEGLVFPFFRQFIDVLPALQAYSDETLVEYRTREYHKDAHIMYHFALEKNGIRQQYEEREMKEMYRGVYVTGFLLFFGEQMHYYVTDDAAEKNVVESGTVGQDARIPEETDDRFGRINRISMLAAVGRDEEAIAGIERYADRAFIVDRLFGKDDTDAV